MIRPQPLITRQYLSGSAAVLMANSAKVIVDCATITNTSATPQSVNMYINTPSGSGATTQMEILYGKLLAVDECYMLPELRGRVFEIGSGLTTTCDNPSTVCASISGRVVSQ